MFVLAGDFARDSFLSRLHSSADSHRGCSVVSAAISNPDSEAGQPAPGPWQRVILTFVAPSRAFTRLGSGGSWWLPYLLALLVGLLFVASVGSKVGWETVTRNNLANSTKQQAQIDKLPPAQQQQQVAMIARITRTIAWISPVVASLIVGAIVAGVLLGTFNFGLGAHATYGGLFAVYFFSTLPQVLKGLLEAVMLLLGAAGDSFQISNPLGSNPAFYLQGSSTPHWIISTLSWLDFFTVWQLVLLIIGSSIVAKVSRGKAAAVVLGWVAVVMLLGAAGSMFS